ncbi:MAG: DNA-directed DNA polymerase [archaeon]
MEKQIKFIPVDYDYFDFNGENYAKIIGRDDKGKRVCIIDSCDVYFWAVLKEGVKNSRIKTIMEKIDKIQVNNKSRKSRVLKTEVCNKKFLGKDVKAIKIFITNYKDAHDIADKIGFKEVDKRREYDLSYITKYILERKVKPLVWYDIEGDVLNNDSEFGNIDNSLDVDLCLKVSKVKESDKQEEFKPRILAYDIETDEFEIGKSEVLMISLVGEGPHKSEISGNSKIKNSGVFKKVLTWKGNSKESFVEKFKDEEEMLENFLKYIKEYDPDILTGYFSDGFDLPYLRARAEKNKIKLSLGIDGSQPVFSRGRMMTGRIKGIVHLDLLRFIRVVYSQYLQSETLSLNDVSNELLGEKKAKWEFKHSSKIKGDEWNDYFKYNLKDSDLTFRLAEKIWPDILEFTKIIQEPLFDVSRDSMATQVENYVIHNLDRFNEIVEKRPIHSEISDRRDEERFEGAFVFQPIPGLYENVVFFDFTSMYASVIVTFNLSRSSFSEKKSKNDLEVDLGKEKAYFSKGKDFFPAMLEDIIEKRKKYKKEYALKKDNLAKARSNSFKLLANAAYGYQGFFGARYYCLPAAASTAALARKKIKETIEFIKKQGYEVVYSDTDSIALLKGDKNKKNVLELLDKINNKLPGIMELDLEGFFKRGIWVTKRTGEFGAKKKYALIGEDNKIKIRGFETVRRDWCTLARETQNKVLELILNSGNEKKAIEYLKEVVNKIKSRKVDLNKLIIRTQLKKPIEDYKNVSPHVTIARKMKKEGRLVNIGMLIEYYIAESENGKKNALVRERAKLPDEPGKYDIEYYLKNQILPAVENIIQVFDININELLDGKRQMSLGEF